MVILRVMIGRVAACRFADLRRGGCKCGGAGRGRRRWRRTRDAAGGERGGRVRSEQWGVGPRDRARMEGCLE